MTDNKNFNDRASSIWNDHDLVDYKCSTVYTVTEKAVRMIMYICAYLDFLCIIHTYIHIDRRQ